MEAEELACEFLTRQGLVTLKRNFSARTGEIDLVMLDGTIVVFVEVRSRKSNSHLHVLETIDFRKRKRIIRTSQLYLQNNRSLNYDQCRFDIILLTGNSNHRAVEWIKNAFEN